MASTNRRLELPAASPATAWRGEGLRYYSCNFYLRNRFGGRVQKVSVDAGFTCPNVDGKVATGGCNFCDNRSFSPSRRLPRQGVLGQIDEGIRRLKRRYTCDQFLAYFQPATNTYAPVSKLRPLYESVLEHPQIVGVAIGTRPDCVPDDVLELLQEFAQRTYLSVEYGIQTIHDRSLAWMNRGHGYDVLELLQEFAQRTYLSVEYGIQTIHDRSLAWMNRGHGYDVFPDAVERSRGRGFEICAHVILGIPGESHDDMMATADALAALQVDSVKIHNLYAVKNTPLGDDVRQGKVELMGRDEYVRTVVDFIERLPPQMIIERISGDAPADYFVGPSWCLDKPGVLTALRDEFSRRDTWQGARWSGA